MASVPPFRAPVRRRIALGVRARILIGALLLVLCLRMIPAQSLDATDGPAIPGAAPASQPRLPWNDPPESFPGAGYFFTEGAFAPVAPSGGVVTTLGDANVLQLDTGPSALSMALHAASWPDRARALQCMTNALYYEAANEPEEGQRAIAQVILNRIASGQWPSSVCGVIYEGGERADRGCQFTFSCDGSMMRIPASAAWLRARAVAQRALSGDVFAPAGLATFYHTLAVHPPWADRMQPVAVIGAHIFYRLPGAAGSPRAFAMRYSGRELAQPGPYAFIAPSRPLLAPPGPVDVASADMAMIGTAATGTTSGVAATPNLPYAPAATPPQASGLQAAGNESPLPQSTIRPEYRNSGRPLR